MSETKIRTRMLKGHRAKCDAVRMYQSGDWSTPWAFFSEVHAYYGDSIGRQGRGGHRRWMVARCNDPDCSARLAVHEDDVLAAVTRAE